MAAKRTVNRLNDTADESTLRELDLQPAPDCMIVFLHDVTSNR